MTTEMETIALHELPGELYARPLTIDDAVITTDLVNDCYIAEIGNPVLTTEQTVRDWQTPDFDMAASTLGVFTAAGDIVGMLEIWSLQEPRVRPYAYARVHPDFEGQGIGTVLLRYAEDVARRGIPDAPPHARVSLRVGAHKQNQDAQDLFANEGFAFIRQFYRMVIELDGPPPAPAWPDGIVLRHFEDTEANHRAIHAAMEEGFADHWGHLPISFDKWLHFTRNDPDYDPTLWYMAMDGDEIAGMTICRQKLTEDPDMGWVDDLAVRRPWRRRGIALALLHHSFGELYRRGQRKVGLGVDASSLTGATRLYEKAGMHIARQTVMFEKELRPGEELSTQELDS